MSDDIVKRLRERPYRGGSESNDDAARRRQKEREDGADLIEAQAAEITRLRAAINDALTASFPDPELNSGWQQEPIGPNETPEEAIKRLVSVRAEWAVHKNNCENPVIAELRAALATARREGIKEAAQSLIEKYQSMIIRTNTPEAWRISILQDLQEMAGEKPNIITAADIDGAAIRAALEGGKDG